ncbi:hypothetical protein [Cohnella sp. JJ-181]|uniref:hypothetical protein n=1 Tax=Cohnella rhizoplanae TaxID=2974897 RepID=UPI0022FF89B9|nr:hypothetical protein [Cohnella sp. JJ-181]CAI6072870.1 hypothetical protein COHCIP112018_02363 [Cohnella sp. JJ-181]
MGDVGDYWRDAKEHQQRSKWEAYDRCREEIVSSGVPFTEKANGHFIIGEFDFWATTGLYIHRKTKRRGRGVKNLLALIGSV